MSTASQTNAAIAANIANTTYPQTIEVPVVFKITVADAENKALFLDLTTGAVNTEFIADLFDILDGQWDLDKANLSEINNLSRPQIKALLQPSA